MQENPRVDSHRYVQSHRAKYANGVLVELPYPTDDVRLMIKAAVEVVDRVYRPGFKYSKNEVLLVNLCQKGDYTEDLFCISQPVATEKVMGVLDAINGRWTAGQCASPVLKG